MTSVANESSSVAALAERLALALKARGLAAEVVGAAIVWASNRAADPPADDPRAVAMSPGLQQTVVCHRTESGRPFWHWVWSGTTHDAAPDYEPLCPGEEIEQAATKIARVLHVDAGPEQAP
jgi:hypothetical protein